MLSCCGFVQGSLGPATSFLRVELDFGYTIASLHLSGFAAGMVLTGVVVCCAVIAVQAALAEHYTDAHARATALTEANLGGSIGSICGAVCLSGFAATWLGWRRAAAARDPGGDPVPGLPSRAAGHPGHRRRAGRIATPRACRVIVIGRLVGSRLTRRRPARRLPRRAAGPARGALIGTAPSASGSPASSSSAWSPTSTARSSSSRARRRLKGVAVLRRRPALTQGRGAARRPG
jgi:MFS family permease